MARDQAAYLRAWRWKKEPLKGRVLSTGRKRKKEVLYVVRPVSREMRAWITSEDIQDARNKAVELNSR